MAKEIKDFLEFNENNDIPVPKLMGYSESSAKRKIHSTKCPHKKLEQSYTSNLTAYLRALEQKESRHS